jgi:Mg2+/Co2+ transporter CorB
MVSLPVTLGALLALVGLSAFFSSSETAIFTVPDDWLASPDADDDPRAKRLRAMRADPHRLLVTILLGNNVVNVAIASLSTVVAIEYLPAGSAVTVSTLVVSFVVLVFGEIVPKSYGLGHARRWALAVAGPLRLVERALYPLVVVFDALTRRVTRRIGGVTSIEAPYVDE